MKRSQFGALGVWMLCATVGCCTLGCSRSHLGNHGPDVGLREPGVDSAHGSTDMPAAGTAGNRPDTPTASQAPGTAGAAENDQGRPSSETIAAAGASNALPTPIAPQPPTPEHTASPAPASIVLADVPVPPPGIVTEGAAEIPVGVWVGETRVGIACEEMSRRVVLQIAAPHDEEPALATIVFGSGPFPGAAVDPERGFPIGDDPLHTSCRTQQPSAGFVYGVLDGHVAQSGRISFRVAVAEPFERWCALQISTPIPEPFANPTGYSCVPPLTDEELSSCKSAWNAPCAIDIDKFWLCATSGACLCFADGCRGNLNRTLFFDMQLDGSNMEGVVSLFFSEDVVEVRLHRLAD